MVYRLNTILWIEDQWNTCGGWAQVIAMNPTIAKAYGPNMTIVESPIEKEVEEAKCRAELERIIASIDERSAILNLKTAQMGRNYLERVVPGGIICDSNFPLNGRAVVQWLQHHGLNSYPLIGFSATRFEDLSPEVQEFFRQTSAVYYTKQDFSVFDFPKLVEPLIVSRAYVEIMARTK